MDENSERLKIIGAIRDIAFDEEGKPAERLRALAMLLELDDADGQTRDTAERLERIFERLKAGGDNER